VSSAALVASACCAAERKEEKMSKLTHSNEATMNELDRKRAIADGNEDLIDCRCVNCGEDEVEGGLDGGKCRYCGHDNPSFRR